MNWTDYPNKIYLLNLPERKDRLRRSSNELQRYRIPFEVVTATKSEDGREGLKRTLNKLFIPCLQKGYQRVLVFEDDVKFVADPNKFMPLCIQQLPAEWDLLYLGINPSKPFKQRYSTNLFLLEEGWSTHAVMYSRQAMEAVVNFEPHERPIDVLLAWRIQILGKSFVSYPMIATQKNGYSDIEKMNVNYKSCLTDEYSKQAKQLLKSQ